MLNQFYFYFAKPNILFRDGIGTDFWELGFFPATGIIMQINGTSVKNLNSTSYYWLAKSSWWNWVSIAGISISESLTYKARAATIRCMKME